MRSLVILLGLLSGLSVTATGESPREFARRFYAAHQTWQIRGVPEVGHEGAISQFMGSEIIRAFRRVNEHRELETKLYDPKNPRKPRFCMEGDVFCEFYEGITHYSVGRAQFIKGRWIVEAHLEYIENDKSYPWTDIVVLDRAAGNWVVADIRYAGGGKLLRSILEELEVADKEIPKTKLKPKSK